MNERIAYRVDAFNASRPAPTADLAALHGQLLAHSPVALLGPEFMQGFYYSVLPRMDLIFGATAYVNDRPAGFIVATADSAGFMRAGLRRAWLRLGWVMFSSVIRHPVERIKAIREAFDIMRGVEQAPSPSPVGELLSFAVLPEFRERRFVTQTRLRISQDLIREAMNGLRAAGVTSARAIVDADNLEARLFYLGNGWTPGLAKVAGWRKHTVEFLWQAELTTTPQPHPQQADSRTT